MERTVPHPLSRSLSPLISCHLYTEFSTWLYHPCHLILPSTSLWLWFQPYNSSAGLRMNPRLLNATFLTLPFSAGYKWHTVKRMDHILSCCATNTWTFPLLQVVPLSKPSLFSDRNDNFKFFYNYRLALPVLRIRYIALWQLCVYMFRRLYRRFQSRTQRWCRKTMPAHLLDCSLSVGEDHRRDSM